MALGLPLPAMLLDSVGELNRARAATLVGALWLCGCQSFPEPPPRLLWHSGFEDGFPAAQWERIDNGSYSADGTLPPGRASAWAIVERSSAEPVVAGSRSYKGWVSKPSASPHRAYPVVHGQFATPLVNTFFVYLDVDYGSMADEDWIHLGTWGNHDPDTKVGKWALHTLAVRQRRLEFAHTDPFHGEQIGREPAPEFPLRRWVRIAVYIHYKGHEGFVQAWQDGEPVLRAKIPALSAHPGSQLRSAHWGMYASGAIARAVQYNDDIRLCSLDAPLSDLRREPACPEPPD